MYLYDICVNTGYAACVSVNHTTGYQDVTLFCRFPTQTTAKNICKLWLPLPKLSLYHHCSLRTDS
jgi:hypothetical protein